MVGGTSKGYEGTLGSDKYAILVMLFFVPVTYCILNNIWIKYFENIALKWYGLFICDAGPCYGTATCLAWTGH